jgi:undecaprenyl diphosphate synthase
MVRLFFVYLTVNIWQLAFVMNIDTIMVSMNQPQHVGIIMDGNRRAGETSFGGRLEGHREGVKTASAIVRATKTKGIPYLTFYAFSTENWKRSEGEVTLLMTLFREFFDEHVEAFLRDEIAVRCIGRRDRLPTDIIERIESIEERSPKDASLQVLIAIDYGGRDELVRAFTKIQAETTLDEETITNALDTTGIPDPDLIIRTGGEHRLSGFLLWQSAYAELYVTEVLWPHFTEVEYDAALTWYSERERRHGK